ncbi:MAG: hypothetical protein IJZ90_02735 [Clostridia bacterium]|nr:hypothetical protein [Clostridia bacterium]
MGSAIVYSKRLKGEVTARPYSFTGNIAVFAGMLSLKPCKIENISFDEKTELLVIVAESAGIVAERGEDSISFKGNPNPRGTYGEVTKGLFDNFSEIPYEPCGKEYFLRSDMPSDILIALFMGLVLAEDDSHVVFTNIPDSINTLELFINVLGRFGIYIESSN